jgi:hypothetical protein
MEEGQPSSASGNILELFYNEHLPLKIGHCILDVSLEGAVLISSREVCHDLLACHIFSDWDPLEKFLFHWTNPRLGLLGQAT